mgnify:FL=1
MKYIYLFVCFFCTTLQAQTLEGAFSFQGEEIATSNILLTAIGGQPFEGTTVEMPLYFGFIEVVSTANEYTNVSALTLEKDHVSAVVGEQLQLTAAFSPVEVDNPMVGTRQTLRWWQ